ncbi:MAG TPA: Nif3-like dinuclear metal center hexameric protein [Propionibacteriaceae bacterium]|nr:Nif3-like dinuclear metal center hexameric protein [Propionibacteriaceae bacterium]
MSDVAAVLAELYPPATAEPWDRVGLTVGDPAASVTKILYAVDCTSDVVEEAARVGADLVVAHHPLLLRGLHAVTENDPKGRIVTQLVRRRIALYVAHTNADIPPGGVAAALADAAGLISTTPLLPSSSDPLDVLVTFVPDDHTATVVEALSAAGAGAVGTYDQCSFRSPGQGTFRPLPGSQPYLGSVGRLQNVDEDRVEMVLPRDRRRQVVEALLATHPYETPAYHVLEVASTQGDSGLGRVGPLAQPASLADFAAHLASVLPRSGAGMRVSGDPERMVFVAAVQAGAGEDLLEAARTSGADVYVTSDLRHHPASEAREYSGGPALIDIPHWAAEATWLPVVQRLVHARLTETGTTVPSAVSEVVTDPWSYLS